MMHNGSADGGAYQETSNGGRCGGYKQCGECKKHGKRARGRHRRRAGGRAARDQSALRRFFRIAYRHRRRAVLCPISVRRCRKNFSPTGRRGFALFASGAVRAERGVEFLLGTAAAKVDLRGRFVTLADGRDVPFHTLVFATGTCARRLPLPGIDRNGTFSLRAIGDVQRLRPAFDQAKRIVILGGGYIGLETAAVMRKRAARCHRARSRGSRAQARHRASIAGFFDRIHRERGVDIRANARVAASAAKGGACVALLMVRK